jgi:hypothetical protein
LEDLAHPLQFFSAGNFGEVNAAALLNKFKGQTLGALALKDIGLEDNPVLKKFAINDFRVRTFSDLGLASDGDSFTLLGRFYDPPPSILLTKAVQIKENHSF